jgi:hypothetical protein
LANLPQLLVVLICMGAILQRMLPVLPLIGFTAKAPIIV